MAGSAFAEPKNADDLEVWKLAPRTPWVTEAREIINLGGPGSDWKGTFTAAVQGDFIKMAGSAKVYLWTNTPVDEATAKWAPVDLPISRFVASDWRLPIGYYERTLTLTEAQAARNVRIAFESIGVHYKVWVNGQLAADVPLTSTFLEQHDISALVKPGENTLRIMVGKTKGQDDSWIDWPLNGAKHGIVRPFYLELRDPVAIESVAVRTALEPEKRMTVVVTVTNTTDRAVTRELKGVVADTAWSAAASVTLKPGEGKRVKLAKEWPDARLWSPADPYLHFLDLTFAGDGGADAYRQRFGFREIRWQGTDRKALLNGKPFTMLRNSTAPFGLDRGQNLEMINLLRSRGIVGFRYFTQNPDLARFCDLCDECGFLVSPAACSGWGAGFKTDLFWPRWKRMLGKMLDQCMNNPSIICWGLSNEFGTVYGGKDNMENAIRQGEVGEWVQAQDPTRPWTMYGEIELRWHGVEGPMPIRSYHYPYGVAGTVLPQGGRWFADGRNGWQGAFTNDKPVSVSEDLFHGFQDAHATMAKALVGDRVYTLDGYAEAMWYTLRKYCEGYYLGDVAGWDPWCFFVEKPECLVYRDLRGTPHPNRLLMMKEYNRNVTSGTRTPFTLIAANRAFAPVKGTLVREIRMGGKSVSVSGPQRADVDNGFNVAFPFEVEAPSVKTITPFELVATWTGDDNEVIACETFEFVSVPAKAAAEIRVPGAVAAIMTRENATLAGFTFAKGIHQTVAAALEAKPEAIVLYGTLPTLDAQILDDWTKTGGRVLQLEPAPDDWSVAKIAQEHPRRYSFAFRRDDEHMTEIPDAAMRLWAPEGYVGDHVFQKPVEDARVLWESVHEGGMRWAEVAWFWRGKGGWLVSTLPALARLGVEPVAGHVLQSLFNELVAANAAAPSRQALLVDFNGPGAVDALFKKHDAYYRTVSVSNALAETAPAQAVWIVDAKGQALPSGVKAFVTNVVIQGGTAVVLDMARETDAEWLGFLGITWEPPLPTVMAPIPWQPSKTNEVDTSRHFFTHVGNAGPIAGINNEDLFWWLPEQMWVYYRFPLANGHPTFLWNKRAGEPVSAYFESADAATRILTAPGAIGCRTIGQGKVLFATFGIDKKGYGGDHPEKVYMTVKTLVNNAGAPLSKVLTPAAFEFVDLAPVATAASWRKPGAEKLAFVPSGVDFRYFPVNRCGWSFTAQNFCPVEPLPAVPLSFNGVYFRFIDPDQNDGKDLLYMEKGLDRVTLKLPRKMKVSRVHFLGFSKWANGGEVFFGDQEKPVPIVIRDHVANWADNWDAVKSGVKVYDGIWDIPTADRAEGYKPGKAFVYHWFLDNPEPGVPIDHIDLGNATHIGLFAVTLEE
ncbi:MAG: sugar-binding domain-containing protein [Kiritimatiellia bacterium]